MGQGVSGHDLNTLGRNGTRNRHEDLFDNEDTNKNEVATNKFSDKTEWSTKLEEGKQGKHILGHPNYVPGKSKLTITMHKAKVLVKDFSGKGKVLGNKETSNKEWVDFAEIIGIYVDREGNELPTTEGLIHHSSNGTHIVPSNPKGEY